MNVKIGFRFNLGLRDVRDYERKCNYYKWSTWLAKVERPRQSPRGDPFSSLRTKEAILINESFQRSQMQPSTELPFTTTSPSLFSNDSKYKKKNSFYFFHLECKRELLLRANNKSTFLTLKKRCVFYFYLTH